MAEIIGKGERPVIQSLKEILALEEEPVKAYPRSGIFTQFPITKLLPIQELVTMSEKYKKGKLDILVKKTTDSEPVAVRVNFVDHDNLTGKRFKRIKGTKDEIQRKILERSNVGVMDLDWFEDAELFDENSTEEEIRDCLKNSIKRQQPQLLEN